MAKGNLCGTERKFEVHGEKGGLIFNGDQGSLSGKKQRRLK